jgi:hypothetical protein
MRLRSIRIAGFRGFNEEKTIDLGERLTLISAPNSYGKTSITEALEFLLFGQTSKVEHAESKDEYRDSYRNSHWPPDKAAYVEAVVTQGDSTDAVLRVELDASGEIRRFVNGSQVSKWPFAGQAAGAASPFILQHALKYLLLVPPNQRFQGFARLLGLNEVDELQRAIVSLCTKPEVTIPADGRKALADLESIEARMAAIPDLAKAGKDLKKSAAGVSAAYAKIEARADTLVDKKVPVVERLAHLVRARDNLAARVYSGSVALRAVGDPVQQQFSTDQNGLTNAVSRSFIEDYSKLATFGVAERLVQEAELLKIGVEFIAQSPDSCPLCGQTLSEDLRRHITERHEEAMTKVGRSSSIQEVRLRVVQTLDSIQNMVARHRRVLESRGSDLLSATKLENRARVEQLFGKSNETAWSTVRSASADFASLQDAFVLAAERLTQSVTDCRTAIESKTEAVVQVESLGLALNRYLATARELTSKLDIVEPTLLEPARILRHAVDQLAGTAELTLVIELCEKKTALGRALRIRDVLEGLKDLKKAVEQTVAETMEAAIDADLTGSVMDWYGKIRTQGDPDVHFSGFAMDRTKAGDFKKGRVKIRAHSYGVELVSAVSSLSESKLNALGLCVSIANALRASGPWEFLVLDDPIQSWDAEHESQFVRIVHTLAESQGKQIILLSHNTAWIQQVCSGCRTLNGVRYEITGYTKLGPHLTTLEWATIDQRLREAETIANDPTATTVRLQQAEEEIRLVYSQLAAKIAFEKLGRQTSPHNMNGGDVRAILNEAGYPASLIDRVATTFVTADDSHHAPKRYQPNAQRIRQSLATLRELKAAG